MQAQANCVGVLRIPIDGDGFKVRDGAATFTREVFILNSAVERKVDTYPPIAKAKFLEVRAMIFEPPSSPLNIISPS